MNLTNPLKTRTPKPKRDRTTGMATRKKFMLVGLAIYLTFILMSTLPYIAETQLRSRQEEMDEQYDYYLVFETDGPQSHYIVDRVNTSRNATIILTYTTASHTLEVEVTNIKNLTIDCNSIYQDESMKVFKRDPALDDSYYIDFFATEHDLFTVNVVTDHEIEALRFKSAPKPAIVYVDDVEWWKAQLNYSFEAGDIVLTHVPMGNTNVKLYFKDRIRPNAIFSIMESNTYKEGPKVYGYINKEITFNASESNDDGDGGTIESFDWAFGDDTFGTGEVGHHSYSTPGEYNVTLTIIDNYDLVDSITQSITIVVFPPEAIFSIMENNTYIENQQVYGYVNKEIMFNATASNDDSDLGSIIKYEWNFDDASSDTGVIVSHIFTAPAEYNVTLSVTDDYGLIANYTLSIVIVGIPPSANFSILETNTFVEDDLVYGYVNKDITFDASGSTDDADGGTIESYSWDFGDSSTPGSGSIVKHKYSLKGTYTVKLTVRDNFGLSDSHSANIIIRESIPENDKDKDGMDDSWELNYSLNPNDPNDKYGDLDGDGLTNWQEFLHKTNPGNSDTDGDGMDDSWEIQYGLNPFLNDANDDKDGDGYSNIKEYEAKTNPINRNDFPPEKKKDDEEKGSNLLLYVLFFIIILVIIGIIFAIKSRKSEEQIDEEFDEQFAQGITPEEAPITEEYAVPEGEGLATGEVGLDAMVGGVEEELDAYECPECSATIYEDQENCSSCGAPLEWEESGEEDELAEEGEEEVAETEEGLGLGAATGASAPAFADTGEGYEEGEEVSEGEEELFECPTCGASVAEDDIICPSCGEEFE